MPNLATQPRTTRRAHRGSRGPARWIASEGGPEANRRATLPVAVRAVQRSTVLDDAAVLRERARIARELHDSVAQTLYAIGLVARRARELDPTHDADQVEGLFDRVVQLAGDGQAEVRALLANLWAEEPKADDITHELSELAADHERCHGIQVDVALAPDAHTIPRETAEALRAIAREALSNVARHAGATRVDLEYEVGAMDLTLRIVDDGRGFDVAVPSPGHFGLRSMRERAEAIGGTLRVTSTKGAGTHLQVLVPRDRSA